MSPSRNARYVWIPSVHYIFWIAPVAIIYVAPKRERERGGGGGGSDEGGREGGVREGGEDCMICIV